MSHDGSEDPIDYTVSNAIYDMIEGKPCEELSDDLGWDLADVVAIHPSNISKDELWNLADEEHWPDSHFDDLWAAIEKFRQA